MAVLPIAYGPSIDKSDQDKYRRIAASLIGSARGSTSYIEKWIDLESTDTWAVTKGGAGVINRPSFGVEFDTTAASGSAKIAGDANDDSNKFTFVRSDYPFYLAYYAKFTGTASSNTFAFVSGLDRGDTENAFQTGVLGNLSTTKYVFRDGDDTVTLTSTVSIDANYHLFEVYLDDNGGNFRVDGEAWQSSASVDTDKDWWFEIGVTNSATAERVRWQVDWAYVYAKRT